MKPGKRMRYDSRIGSYSNLISEMHDKELHRSAYAAPQSKFNLFKNPEKITRRSLNIGKKNKVFSSQWIDDDHVVIGTKCNTLSLLNVHTEEIQDIPLLCDNEDNPTSTSCGIHSIQISPSGTHLATGGSNVNNLAIYRLPGLEPHTLFNNVHKDWIFDMRWIDDEHIVSCSRDSSLVLWKLDPSSESSEEPSRYYQIKNESVAQTFAIHRDRLRALEYMKTVNRLAVSTMSRRLYLFDPVRIGQCFGDETSQNSHLYEIQFRKDYSEGVALREWPDQPNLVSLATHNHILLFDIRCDQREWAKINRIIDLNYSHYIGVRSLNFSGPIISFGTSNGTILFYDLIAGKSMPTKLRLSPNYVKPVSNPNIRVVPETPSPGQGTSPFISTARNIIREIFNTNSWNFLFSNQNIDLDSESGSNSSVSDDEEIQEQILVSNDNANRLDDSSISQSSPLQGSESSLRTNRRQMTNMTGLERARRIGNNAGRTSLSNESRDLIHEVFNMRFNSRPNFFYNFAHSYQNSMKYPAVYTHEYDVSKTRLFVAGGPISSNVYGNAASIWE